MFFILDLVAYINVPSQFSISDLSLFAAVVSYKSDWTHFNY